MAIESRSLSSRPTSKIAGSGALLVTVEIRSNSTAYYTSPDGINWTARTLPSAPWAFKVVWTGVNFIIFPDEAGGATTQKRFVSTNGIDWTEFDVPPTAYDVYDASLHSPSMLVGPTSGNFATVLLT